MIDWIGWIGFLILMYAYTRKHLAYLRWFTIVACLFLGISAFWSRNWPLLAVQIFAIIINIYMFYWKDEYNKYTEKK